MPYEGNYCQQICRQLIEEYQQASKSPLLYPQSVDLEDVRYWLCQQAMYPGGRDS